MSRLDPHTAKEKGLLRRQPDELLRRAPASHSTWPYQRTVAFKDAVMKGRRALNAPKTTLHQLRDAVAVLSQFHGA